MAKKIPFLTKENVILIVVFFTGACILIIEIIAFRILAPYFGNTIYLTSSVLSVILASLSLGYYFGGYLADKKPHINTFYNIIYLSGVVFLIFYFISIVFLNNFGHNLGYKFGPLIASIIMFFPAPFLLGMLSPYAIRLTISNRDDVGKISGKVFFSSTLGSIFGSLLAGYYLIPHYGISSVIICISIFLFLISLIAKVIMKNKTIDIIIYTIIAFSLIFIGFTLNKIYIKNAVYEKEGLYGNILVKDVNFNNKPIRILMQDQAVSGAKDLTSGKSVPNYSKYYHLYKPLNNKVKNVLIIGGGTYTTAEELLKSHDDITITVVEIEPNLFDIASKYFGVNKDPKLINVINDGRYFINNNNEKYDLICLDAYYSLFIPFHLTTEEFFSEIKNSLNDDGIVIANVTGELRKKEKSFLFSEMNTFRKVFDHSYFYAVNSPQYLDEQNVIFLGSNNALDNNLITSELKNNNWSIDLSKHLLNINNEELVKHRSFTDDFAPVEALMSRDL